VNRARPSPVEPARRNADGARPIPSSTDGKTPSPRSATRAIHPSAARPPAQQITVTHWTWADNPDQVKQYENTLKAYNEKGTGFQVKWDVLPTGIDTRQNGDSRDEVAHEDIRAAIRIEFNQVTRVPAEFHEATTRGKPRANGRGSSPNAPPRHAQRAAFPPPAPAGPPPTTSTSKPSFAEIFRASRALAPESTLASISSSVMRPWPNGSPFRKIVGTAMITVVGIDVVSTKLHLRSHTFMAQQFWNRILGKRLAIPTQAELAAGIKGIKINGVEQDSYQTNNHQQPIDHGVVADHDPGIRIALGRVRVSMRREPVEAVLAQPHPSGAAEVALHRLLPHGHRQPVLRLALPRQPHRLEPAGGARGEHAPAG